MTPRFVIRPQAQAEIRAAAEWYADQQAGLATRFLDALVQSFAAIRERPLSFSEAAPGRRRAFVRGFPYAVFFLPADADGNVVVLAVHHHRQAPERWLPRR